MRLWYHADSDSLHAAVEWDGVSEDVTDVAKMRKAARDRGIKFVYEGQETADYQRRSIADAIIASYKKWERKPADLYPTPVDGTESVIPVLQVMREYMHEKGLCDPVRVWEPACGDGRMARVLEWHGFDVFGSDFRETPGYGIGGIDFLKDQPRTTGLIPHDSFDMIVTNPPFSLAEQFIRRALSITPNVAMLLKATYWNAASRLPFFAEHRPAFVLPLTFRLAFLESERGKSPLMDCIWVVWSAFGDDDCVFEPIPRRRYPGYAGKGLIGAMAGLEEAMGELGETVHGLVDGSRSSPLLARSGDA